MSRKRVIVGQSEWAVDDKDVETTLNQIKDAMTNGTLAELELLNGAGRSVTVFINGRVTPSVVVDLDTDPKPSEISG